MNAMEQPALSPLVARPDRDAVGAWHLSWPLLVGTYVFLVALYRAHVQQMMLVDGDSYWHVAAGHWMLQHGVVPAADVFSHSMPGAPWTAQEWLAEVILARVHDAGGWGAVAALTSLAFCVTFALLARSLLRTLEPARALLFTVFAVLLAVGHLLARPFVLAMPLMACWMIGVVQAADGKRAPSLWLLPLMALWANLHGGFTLGLAVAGALGLEAAWDARAGGHLRHVMRSWGVFLLLAFASALLTPHGIDSLLFTWQVLMQDTYALDRISEWASPNFHAFQPLELWLLGGLALVLVQGLRLPPVRLALLIALVHLSLKHVRNVEVLGLVVPLLVAAPWAAQWRQRAAGARVSRGDRVWRHLAAPAGFAACAGAIVLLAGATLAANRARPIELPEAAAPQAALAAVRAARIHGPVLNFYSWGGYLIYSGVPVFIDGRSDVYRDAFFREYTGAVELATSTALDDVLRKYRIEWTLLPPGTPAVALLDRMPGWRRLYADKVAVVHVKSAPLAAPAAESAP